MPNLFKKGDKGSTVKVIQELLNKLIRAGLTPAGVFDDATHAAVIEFQKKHGLRPVDGKIGDITGAKLNELSSDRLKGVFPTAEDLEKERKQNSGEPVIPPNGHTSRNSFVESAVQENSEASAIINKIYPYFPKSCTVISAWLSPGDLYWKVNYHWDALRTWLEYAKDHKLMSADEQETLNDMYKRLMSNAPSKTGHYKINKIGQPPDTSNESKFTARWQILKSVKTELKAYMAQQGFTRRNLQYMDLLKYAVEPVALPAKSNHSTGWALDIKGNLAEVQRIAKSLGASYVLKEHPHCHCEFKNGVKLPR